MKPRIVGMRPSMVATIRVARALIPIFPLHPIQLTSPTPSHPSFPPLSLPHFDTRDVVRRHSTNAFRPSIVRFDAKNWTKSEIDRFPDFVFISFVHFWIKVKITKKIVGDCRIFERITSLKN